MSDQQTKDQPKIPPPPPRQPDPALKGYIERGNKSVPPPPRRDGEQS